MANISLTVTGVVKRGATVYVQFSDDRELEFGSLAAAVAYGAGVDKEMLKRLAIARYLAVDPTAANPALIVGHVITYTDTSNGMVTVS